MSHQSEIFIRCTFLKKKLIESVQRNKADAILLSGGLDSAVLAFCYPNIKAITVRFMEYGEDKAYASSCASFLNIKHYEIRINIDEAIEAIPEVIKILSSFDPAICNDLVIYFGLRSAKELGMEKVATGDGSDELFAGYSFMQNINNLECYIARISKKMSFSSNKLGDFFRIEIKQPYIDRKIVQLALKIPISLKIKEGYGKWILRKAFEENLPYEIIWQDKRPLEYGSGMAKIKEIIGLEVSDDEFRNNKDPIKFISKEHYYYYKVYKKVIGEIPKPKENEKECPGCGAGIKQEGFHCKVCGFVEN